MICFFPSYISVDEGMWGNLNIDSPSTGVNLSRPLARKAGIVISALVMGEDSLSSKDFMHLRE